MITLILFSIFISTLSAYIWHRNRFPGPFRLPFVGSLPFLKIKNRELNRIGLDKVVTSDKISLVQLAGVDMYIINDYDIAKELFNKDIFSQRNAGSFINYHRLWGNGKGSGIIFNNGEGWTNQRRFSLRTLRDFGFGKKSAEETMNIEIDEMIEKYSEQKSDVLIGLDFNLPIINILWQMVANSRITDPKGEQMVKLVTELFTSPTGANFLPYFIQKMFPKKSGLKARSAVLKEHKNYLLDTIEEHEKTFDEEHMRDFIDAYLSQMKTDTQGKFSKYDLASNLLDFFHAGTETSSTTLKWFVLFMTLHQDWQEKCREEMRQVLGSNRPELKHMQQLNTLMATITEVQRLSKVAAFTLPHHLAQDFKYKGHTFSKDSMWRVNLGYIMKDPDHFHNPSEFNPARFLDSNTGKFVKNERVIPFGIGKRVCMGELLAKNEVYLFAANLVQKLEFLPPADHPLPDKDSYTAQVSHIPTDYYVRIKPTDM